MSVLTGIGLGGLVGLGATFTVYGAPRNRRPKLEDRLAPYLRDAPRKSSLLTHAPARTPFPTLERILRPVMGDATRMLDRVLGGTGSTRRRLEQAGRQMTVDEFRAEQVLWAAIGLLAGVGLSLALLAGNPHRSPVMLLLLCFVTSLSGVVARDYALTQEVSKREQRMLAEFPTVAEMLALAVGAGEGPVGALERVTRTSRGELAKELGTALAEARAGATLVSALENIAARTSLPALARFVDGVAVAVERGTPLAEVLRAQAVDVREAGKRALLESGGKKEIAMMVPVVFLILPVTMLFALFPGLVSLRLLA
ncbi:MAG TPA: type II secretion system F family protein [Acidothermaceae bacterium]|nr:type II secretion system F family protein [Acidothermaceae bacterium]